MNECLLHQKTPKKDNNKSWTAWIPSLPLAMSRILWNRFLVSYNEDDFALPYKVCYAGIIICTIFG
jgi:hypothetical protein